MNQAQSLACPNCGSTMEVRMIGSNYKEGYCPVCDTRVDLSHTIPQQQTPQAINVHIPVASQQNTGNGAGVIVAIAAALVVLIGGVVAFAVQTESSTSSGSSSISISEPIVSYSGGDLNSSAPSYVELTISNPIQLDQQLIALEYSPDGSRLAVSGKENYVAILDGETLEVITTFEGVNAELPSEPDVTALAFSPDGATLAVGSWGGYLELWDVETARRTTQISIDEASTYNDMQYTADGTQLIVTTGKRNILVINVPGGDVALETTLPVSPATIAVVNDEQHVAVGLGVQKRIAVFDLSNGNEVRSISTADQVDVVIASPDGNQIAVVGSGEVRIHDTTTWQVVTTLTPLDISTFSPRAAAFSPDGRYLAAGNFFATGVIWELETGVDLVHFEDVRQSESLIFTPDTTRLITRGGTHSTISGVGEGNLLRVWDVESALAEEEPEVEDNTELKDAEAIDESTG